VLPDGSFAPRAPAGGAPGRMGAATPITVRELPANGDAIPTIVPDPPALGAPAAGPARLGGLGASSSARANGLAGMPTIVFIPPEDAGGDGAPPATDPALDGEGIGKLGAATPTIVRAEGEGFGTWANDASRPTSPCPAVLAATA
jgi:hypothetical protein